MKAKQFRNLIHEEVRNVLKEDQLPALIIKAKQFKKELDVLLKDPEKHAVAILNKEEQLRRVAAAIRNIRADESFKEGSNSLAKDIADLIGKKLDPASFYEYLQDYSKDEPYGEYGFDEDQLDTLIDAFSEIDQEGLGMTDLNTSKVNSSKLYKAYFIL